MSHLVVVIMIIAGSVMGAGRILRMLRGINYNGRLPTNQDN